MAEFGVVQIKQEPLDQDYQLPVSDTVETGCNGNSTTEENRVFSKKKRRTQLKTLLFGNGLINQSEASHNTQLEVETQNINQSGSNFQKDNLLMEDLDNYQMYIKTETVDDSYARNNMCYQIGVTGINNSTEFIKVRPGQGKEVGGNSSGTTVLSGCEELVSPCGPGTAVVVPGHEECVSSSRTAVVPNCEKHISRKESDKLQHFNLELKKSSKVSNLQKSHKKLSGLLSCGTSTAGCFDLSSPRAFDSSAVLCKPTGVKKVSEKERQDKNGELLQMLLTKGPSSYIRDPVLDIDSSPKHNDSLTLGSSSASLLSPSKPLASVSADSELFFPKTSSPALRKILGSKPPSNLQDSNVQGTNNNGIPTKPLSCTTLQNPSQNVEMSIASSSTSLPGRTTLNFGSHTRRLDATIRKLMAKQTEKKTCPNTVPQGIKDLMKKSVHRDVNSSSTISRNVSSDVEIERASCSNSNSTKAENIMQIKDEPIENNRAVLRRVDQVSSRLMSNFMETDSSEVNASQKRGELVKENHCRVPLYDSSAVGVENSEKRAAVNKIKPTTTDIVSDATLLDKKTEDPVFNNNNSMDGLVCPSRQPGPPLIVDKYKTLQQHLIKPPTISSQIPIHPKPLAMIPTVLAGSPRKRKSEDEEWLPPGGIKVVVDEPVKRPFMEKPLFYKCYECGKAFEHKGTLKVHERMHSMEKQEFKCDICGKVCSAKGYLEIHMRTHRREFSCNFIPPQLSEIPSEMPSDTNAHHTCSLCGKFFTELENLLIHLRMHSGEKLYKCEVCGNGFTRKTQLSIHMRIHTGEKPYECEVCGKTFRQSNGLNLHMTTHTDDKPYKCEICGGGFGRKAHYEKHMRKHRGERPFLCGVCSKGFTDKFTLSMHMKIHNKKKDHVCDICNKGFNQSTHLRNHMRFHTEDRGYRCEECNMLFEHKRTLKNHFKSVHSETYHKAIKLKRRERNKRRAAFRKSKLEAKKSDKEDLVASASEGENGDSDDETSSSEDDSDNDTVLGTKIKEEPPDVCTVDIRIENVEDDDNIHFDLSAQNVEGHKVCPTENVIKQEILDNGCNDLSSEASTGQDEVEKRFTGLTENVIHANELNAGNVGSEFVHFRIKQEPVDETETFSLHSTSMV